MLNTLFKYMGRYGGIILGVMIYFFITFTNFEEKGIGFRENSLIVLLYNWIGKWGVTIVLGIISIVWIRYSYKHLQRKRKGELIDGKNPDGSENLWN